MLIYFGKLLLMIYHASKNIVRELLIYKNKIKLESHQLLEGISPILCKIQNDNII